MKDAVNGKIKVTCWGLAVICLKNDFLFSYFCCRSIDNQHFFLIWDPFFSLKTFSMTGIWAMAQGPRGFLWPMFSSMPWSLLPASLCARHLWKTLIQQHHLVAWPHSCHLQQGKFSKTKQNYSKREILFRKVLRYSSVFCLDFSTGDQPDASVSPEGSSSGLQAQQQQQQQQRVSIHKPFTQSRVPPDLPMHPAPRNITDEELRVLEGCLHRWRSEVENDTRGTNKHACKHVLILISCCFGLYKCTCFCLICDRSAGQYIQNPQNHRAYVFWQVHDAGKKLFEISDSFPSISEMTPEWVNLVLDAVF